MDPLFHSLGFYPGAPVEQLRRIFNNVLMRILIDGKDNADQANMALFVEALAYEYLIKGTETEEGFREIYNMMVPYLGALALTAPASADFGLAPEPQPVVGFWLPGPAILAHTQQLLIFLRVLKDMKPAPIRPIIYCGSGAGPDLKRAIDELGFPLVFVGQAEKAGLVCPPMEMLKRLRDAVKRDGASALVFVSAPTNLVTACAMQVAPTMLWWSMKWYSLNVPGLDERMTPRRGDSIELGGYTWRCGHVCLPALADPKQKEHRARLRSVWKINDDQILYGWFGRHDKLTPEFGEAIATLLETNDKAIFCFTGRSRVPEFEEKLKHVAPRTRYLGWVDVSAAIWALDVYADSFPMGSGHTAFAAMQAGIPVVTIRTAENEQNSAGAHFMEILLGGADTVEAEQIIGWPKPDNAHPFVPDVGNYHYRLCQLGQDKGMREKIGNMQMAFVQRFLMDADLYAKKTSAIIVEAIARKHGLDVTALAPPVNIPDHAAEEQTQAQAGAEDPGTAGPVEGTAGAEQPAGSGEGQAPGAARPTGDGERQAGDPPADS